MRSSKSRSRGNKNRSRPSGNIVNRVFDSNGPDGKVRGTPQQIIDKYTQLHRDAQLAGDRVDAENFAQHAEHYLRMLAEAQKEQDAKREEQERQNRERQAERDRERAERLKAQEEAANGAAAEGGGNKGGKGGAGGDASADDVIDTGSEDPQDSGLVETPESKPKRSRTRKPKPKPKSDGQDGGGQNDAPPEAAE